VRALGLGGKSALCIGGGEEMEVLISILWVQSWAQAVHNASFLTAVSSCMVVFYIQPSQYVISCVLYLTRCVFDLFWINSSILELCPIRGQVKIGKSP
jgi:hypothetical protein